MRDRPIVITETDAAKLRRLLAAEARSDRDQEHLQELRAELERAVVVESDQMPADAITMHTRVRVLDLFTQERREFVLVFPADADLEAQRLSVLAPLGTALLGYREGDQVEWMMPGGWRRLHIERVLQPAERARGGSARGVLSTATAG